MNSKPLYGATLIYDRNGDDTLTVASSTTDVTNLGTEPGTYDVRVMYTGYADWLMANIVVPSDGCQPKTVGMMVFMQPLPGP